MYRGGALLSVCSEVGNLVNTYRLLSFSWFLLRLKPQIVPFLIFPSPIIIYQIAFFFWSIHYCFRYHGELVSADPCRLYK